MQAKLSWNQARALAESGSIVRREWWLARSLFRTEGDLFWMNWGGVKRVVLSTDFTQADENALDWTDTSPEQGHCLNIALRGAIRFASASIASSGSVTATLALPQLLDEDVTFDLTSDVASVTFPATVTILQGNSSVDFTVFGSSIDITSGLVNLFASSTYIGATGSILYNYAPPPLPKLRFVISATNYNPPNPLLVDLKVARITTGPVPAILKVEGYVDDEVTFDGVVFVTGLPPNPSGANYFFYTRALNGGESVMIGTINVVGAGYLGCTAELDFLAYGGTATCENLV